MIVSSEGVYHSGKKSGSWNYYSRNGHLLHKFDHDLNELKVNNASDSLNYTCPFLGGIDQFYKLFFQIIYDETRSLYPSNAQVKIRLNTKEFPISMELVESNGHEEFPKVLIEILRRMEENFLAEFNEDKNGILYFIGESTFYEYRSTYTLRFEKHKGSNE